MTDLTEGAVHTYERTFTKGDVRQFAEVSNDRQPRHLDPDDEGRLMVHGLLTATLPTKIGGDLEVLASRMDLQFRQPVYTGQPIECRWVHDSVDHRENRLDLTVDVECTVEGEVVLDGAIEGIVWQ
jgi:acyl dehydratase